MVLSRQPVWLWALFRTTLSNSSSRTYTGVQRVEAKRDICAVYNCVRRGVSVNTNQKNPGGDADVTGALVVAANARVSLYDGAQYLLARSEPATPPDLADGVRKFANNLMDIGAAATTGAQYPDPDQAAQMRDADTVNATITALCKGWWERQEPAMKVGHNRYCLFRIEVSGNEGARWTFRFSCTPSSSSRP
jgi:hypothetical protein